MSLARHSPNPRSRGRAHASDGRSGINLRSLDYRSHRSEQNACIQREAAGVDIFAVQLHSSIKRRITPRRDLPKPGDPRRDVEPSEMFNIVSIDIVDRVWPGPNQAHIPPDHIPKLW